MFLKTQLSVEKNFKIPIFLFKLRQPFVFYVLNP